MNRQDPLNSQLDEEPVMRLDHPTPSTGRAGRPATALRASSIAALFLCLVLCLVAGAALAQPTVNGLFHGDGDVSLYTPYANSIGGSVLYSYYDAPAQRLYVALVVSHSVNDLVCSPQNNKDYTSSAGWGPHRSCKRASDSEFATFTLECAPGSPNAWTWQQGLGCNQTAGPPQSNWVSNATCSTSSPASAWPPTTISTSSWVQNVNTYQAAAPATRAWNLYALGNQVDDWKSPFLPSPNNNNATLVPGYPTYSTVNGGGLTYAWEWSMVYEWSVSLGPGGADCGDNAIVFIAGTSHHSPAKSGPENDVFNPPSDPIYSDWGDLPQGGGFNYGTTSASNGPRHHIKVNSPYLGVGIQAETNGTPTADATGDGDEEDGVTANVGSNWTPGSTQSVDVVVSNAPTGAVLAGWFDWNGDGDFNDPGEFFTWNVTQGTNTLSFTVGAGFDWEIDDLYARFRLFSSGSTAPGGSLSQADFVGTATDGEVEDYVYEAGALPVTLNAFSSEGAPGGPMTVRWQTASETENVAFEVHGLVDGAWRPLSDLIETRRGTSALPQSYEVTIDAPPGLTLLQLADYDTRGRMERFGDYRVEASYGEVQPERRIDWRGPRAERSERLRERGFADTAGADTAEPGLAPEGGNARRAKAAGAPAGPARWKRLMDDEPVHGLDTKGHGASGLELDTRRGRVGVQTGATTHVAVTEEGIQRVTYEALRDGGLDLAGVQPGSIAVTFQGQPVPRWISAKGKLGPGDVIEFLGRPPAGDDALYVDTHLYQVVVDSSRARDAGNLGQGKAKSVSAAYRKHVSSDRPLLYHQQSPTSDPWVERSVLVRGGSPSVVTLDLPIAGPVLAGTSHLSVGLGGVTNLPDLRDAAGRVIPEHRVEVWLRSADGSLHHVTDSSASGQSDWRVSAPLPDGWIQPGLNRIELRFSTAYFFSLVVVDSYGVSHPAEYRGPSLDFAPDPFASGYAIGGFSGPDAVAYAEGADGSLTRVATRVSPSGGPGGGYTVELRGFDAARFWVTEAPHAPAVFTTAAPPDLLSEPGDLVVIAGSSFVGTTALDDYLAQRAALDPVVIDVEDVYNAFGHGMALPSAITDFLAARDAVSPFTHVQLVGSDCYDRLSYVSQCLSLVPLPTAPVGVNLYTPSQNRLVDLDGDGIGDKAVGQFSVRSEAELATIVRKGAAWESSGLSAGGSALLIAEETDGLHDFDGQIDRMRSRLGWSDSEVLRMADHPSVLTARDEVRASLGSGRSVTVFSGHSSPNVWAFRALLTTAEVATLTNDGRPTIMVPLACETTYDISPSANVLGHQLLYAGDHGALAISGAVALSSLAENELMAEHVLQGLRDGLTLGQAVLEGRRALGSSYQELQDNWITQGDVAAGLTP
jgi:hypothetical protein